MQSEPKRARWDYSLPFKLSIAEQVEKWELNYKEAQCRYGIQGCTTVLVWLRKYGRQDWSMGIHSGEKEAKLDGSHGTTLAINGTAYQ